MILEYQPNKGFIINSVELQWGESRDSVRRKLDFQHQEDDRTIELAQFFDGDESQNIKQRRDIYRNSYNTTNSFFLSYDENHKLEQLEVHEGIKIVVGNFILRFDQDIDAYISALSEIDSENQELDDGNHLFPNLKLTISNSESNGGEGNGLNYFYASVDINHLTE